MPLHGALRCGKGVKFTKMCGNMREYAGMCGNVRGLEELPIGKGLVRNFQNRNYELGEQVVNNSVNNG